MVWPFPPKSRKQIARIEITGAIASETRKTVLKALKEVEEKKFPALLLRIDSPGGTVGDSQEIYEALKKLQKNVKIVVSFGNISAKSGTCEKSTIPQFVHNIQTLQEHFLRPHRPIIHVVGQPP